MSECGLGRAGGGRPQQVRGGVGAVADQDAGVAAGLRVDADDRLPVEVLRDVGDQAVLADRDHDVLRREQEPGQVVAVDVAAPPARPGWPPPTAVSAACSASCRAATSSRSRPRWRRKYAGGGPGAVPGEQLVELAAAATPAPPGARASRGSSSARLAA